MKVLIYGHGLTDKRLSVTGYAQWGLSRVRAFQSAISSSDELYVADSSYYPQHVEFDIGVFIVSPYTIMRGNVIEREIISNLRSRCKVQLLEILWETTSIPVEWGQVLESFDGFIVGSEFCRSLISNIDKPTFLVPYAIGEIPSAPSIEERVSSNTFRVFYIGQNTVRKGIYDTLYGFFHALGDCDDAELIIKTDNASPHLGQPDVSSLSMLIANSCCYEKPKSKVHVATGFVGREVIDEVFRTSTILLLPSRGEGFGIPYIEAILWGIPSIYVPWSSSVETASYPCNFPVEFVMDAAYGMRKHGYDARSQQYAVPLVGSIIDKLTEAYMLWKTQRYAYFSRCLQARKDAIRRYSVKSATPYAKEVLTFSYDRRESCAK